MCKLVEYVCWCLTNILPSSPSDTDPRVCTLGCLSDPGDPAGQLLQAVGRNVQTLNRLRGEVLGVNGEHEGP